MEKRAPRSSGYQHLILETAYSNDMMEAFSNDDSISSRLNPFAYDEEILELEDELKVEFWRIVESLLTDRQKMVVELSAQGLTQAEIGKRLSVGQSSVTKSLNGNVSYSKDGVKYYGGIKRKFDKIIETDDKIQAILKKMNEIRAMKW